MATVTVTRSRGWWGFYRRILVEMDGKRVGGVWNGRDLKIEVPAGQHIFRAFMGWIGSKPLVIDVTGGSMTVVGVRAPWREAAVAKVSYRPAGPMAQGFGSYTNRLPDSGLEIWECSEPSR
jgi:hypothetical protein